MSYLMSLCLPIGGWYDVEDYDFYGYQALLMGFIHLAWWGNISLFCSWYWSRKDVAFSFIFAIFAVLLCLSMYLLEMTGVDTTSIGARIWLFSVIVNFLAALLSWTRKYLLGKNVW